MPSEKRIKTDYPGVYYIVGTSVATGGKDERIYYIRYRKDGKLIEEKVGRQF
ncbi:MAG: site-specific integrase, partial [Deltaproteobacteria bacterium]|nr:site-specific integrase [Deltaproteobacteria bacterium]